MNNHKEFMEQNRLRYQRVLKEPMDLFSENMNQALMEQNEGLLLTPCISRINRDIRFSKDKSPYKARKWAVFKPVTVKRWQEFPCFYFEVTPEGYFYGLGFYEPSPIFMQAFRSKIDVNPAAFLTALSTIPKNSIFTLEGQSYKRARTKEHEGDIYLWYQKKTFALSVGRDVNPLLFQPELIEKVVADFRELVPFYRYILTLDTK